MEGTAFVSQAFKVALKEDYEGLGLFKMDRGTSGLAQGTASLAITPRGAYLLLYN
jgi:hypothetical protein